MSTWHNKSGKPLSSAAWLEAHHQAKLPERTEFAQRIAILHPKTVVDLGCGSGIWLDLINEYVDHDCELIGLDADENAIRDATDRSSSWSRKSSFQRIDIETESHKIPKADVYLAFNIFPYLKDISSFIEILKSKVKPHGCIVIRQYEGALLRFGPMNTADRLDIEISLQASVGILANMPAASRHAIRTYAYFVLGAGCAGPALRRGRIGSSDLTARGADWRILPVLFAEQHRCRDHDGGGAGHFRSRSPARGSRRRQPWRHRQYRLHRRAR